MIVLKSRNGGGVSCLYEPGRKMSLEEQVRLLSMVDIFEPLSREELVEIGRRTLDIFLGQGEIFYTPEEHGERLFLLKKGRVHVYEVDSEGRELTLSGVEGGTMLEEMALTGQCLKGVYVKALESSVP